jgi:hypothetical protein
MHPEARLYDVEREELAEGLVATFGEEDADPLHDDDHAH